MKLNLVYAHAANTSCSHYWIYFGGHNEGWVCRDCGKIEYRR